VPRQSLPRYVPRHDVRLFLRGTGTATGCLRPIDHEESERMDGQTGGQALDASEKNITGAP